MASCSEDGHVWTWAGVNDGELMPEGLRCRCGAQTEADYLRTRIAVLKAEVERLRADLASYREAWERVFQAVQCRHFCPFCAGVKERHGSSCPVFRLAPTALEGE